MEFIDTHCHIHSVDYPLSITEVDGHCAEAGVKYLVCVGTDAADSERAVRFVADRPNSWAAVGQHPHEAKFGMEPLEKLRLLVEQDQELVLGGVQKEGPWRAGSTEHLGGLLLGDRTQDASVKKKTASLVVRSAPSFRPRENTAAGENLGAAPPDATPGWRALASFSDAEAGGGQEEAERRWLQPSTEPRGDSTGVGAEQHRPKIVAIGECGLDYFYGHSSKRDQEKALRYQIELALEHDLPLIFHVREAFDDFWPIFDSYTNIRGVLHSFTDDSANLSKAITRGLHMGVNGIMTFTKNSDQLEVAKQIPLDRLVLETDSPFLTPVPLRGKVNEPAHVLLVAKFLSELRQMSLQEVAQHTTTNARRLFSF